MSDHAKFQKLKRQAQLADCEAVRSGKLSIAELAEKNALFAHVDMSECVLGSSGPVSQLKV